MMRQKFGRILMALGAVLIICSAGFVVYNQAEDRASGAAADSVLEQMQTLCEEKPADIPTYSSDKTYDEPLKLNTIAFDPDQAMPVYEIDGQYYLGTISAPSVGIYLPVMSEWNYENLKTAPCRYTGSIYSDDMILCAHNYASHFGNLFSLSVGDGVTFTDADGKDWNYTVSQIETIEKYDVDAMTSGDWDLTLFTCTIGGVQRVTVRCVKAESTNNFSANRGFDF